MVGGRAPGKIHRPAKTDPVDSANCLSFVHSSLSPVVLFRRRLSSVRDVLKKIRKSGFTTARWQALMLWWAFVCRQCPTGQVLTLTLREIGFLPTFMVFLLWCLIL